MDALPFIRVPPITAGILALFAISIVLCTFEVVHPMQMLYSPTLVFEQRQYWRLLTNFFYLGKVDLNSLMELHWIYVVSSTIEVQYFHNHALDYMLVLVVGWVILIGVRTFRLVDIPYMSLMISHLLVYLFSRLLEHQQVNLLGLINIPARLVPVFFLFTGMFTQWDGFRSYFFGTFTGHILWYLLEVFPRITGLHLLRVQDRLEYLLGW